MQIFIYSQYLSGMLNTVEKGLLCRINECVDELCNDGTAHNSAF
uniref:Uncharacterized protein n=1 Tax=Onchocerca volvulus TaxID=6282 RepID=A0A8R1XW60_ONCVO